MLDRNAPTEPEAPGGEYSLGSKCGRFEVTGVLGAGGMGLVLSARDPDLDRPVAVKLLYPRPGASDDEQTARLNLEARAMARLAHPNVVTVYEVGAVDNRIFIAMEQVDGTTLRGWLSSRPRTWRDIVAMFVAAGRGLAAAHAVGIVHRDFKPDNVLIGSDGRPRVTDFGLATSAGAPPPDLRGDPDTTFAGVGTPAYMAPEQWIGAVIDARTDQFAFCVALWEALHGERPFAGTGDALREAILRGTLLPPTRRIPRWLDAALRRGLAKDPADRWPDLEALLHVLARRRPGVGVALAFVGVAAVALAALLLRPDPAPPACSTVAAPFEAMWSPSEQLRIGHGFVAGGGPLAPATWQLVAPQVARWGASWSAARFEACAATEVSRTQSPELLDLRMACLDDRRRELAGLLAIFARATPEVAIASIKAMSQLDPASRCADTVALRSVPPPPPDRALQVASVKRAAADVLAAAQLGLVTGTSARAAGVVEMARALDYPPVLAEAQFAHGWAQKADGAYAPALATIEAAALTADKAGDDRLRVRAWSEAIYLSGSSLRQADSTMRAREHAFAAIARVREPGLLVPHLHHDLACAYWGLGKMEDGLREVAAELELLPQENVLERAYALNTKALLIADSGRSSDAVPVYRQAEPLYRTAFGDDHPAMLGLKSNLANALNLSGHPKDAEALLRDAVASAMRAYGPDHPQVAVFANNLANVYIDAERYGEALPLVRQALAIREQRLPPDHPFTLRAVINLATALGGLEQHDESERVFADGIARMTRRLPPNSYDIGYARLLHGKHLIRMGKAADAVRELAAAMQVMRSVRGESSGDAVMVMSWQARAEIDAGNAALGLAICDRALVIISGDPEDSGDYEGLARFHRALALRALGRPDAANTEARAALAALLKSGASEDLLLRTRVERWLRDPSKS